MSEENPWKVSSSRLIYENPWIRLREDQVLTPAGKPGIYSVVECSDAIGVVALGSDLQIHLVGQYRYPLQCYSWEIVAGAKEEGEGRIDAARRELKEETGLIAGSMSLLVDEFHTSNCHSDERAYVYLAEDLTQAEMQPEDTEVLKNKSMPLCKALEMVYEGQITDAISMIGIIKAAKVKGLVL